MIISTDKFVLEIPSGWKVTERTGSACEAYGPNGERATFASVAVQGQGSAKERDFVRNHVRSNAIKAMEAAARVCGLPLVRPLTPNRLASGAHIDEIECRSESGAFLQCAITIEDAVLLMTYETSVTGENPAAAYAQIVNSVRSASVTSFEYA